MTEEKTNNFESLIQDYLPDPKQFSSDKIIKGTLRSKEKNYLLVDVGIKSDGIVPTSEFTEEELENIKEGDEIDVVIDEWEDRQGNMYVSREKARKLRFWKAIGEAYESGQPISGTILSRVKGGLAVDIGIKAFLPNSQVALRPVKNLHSLIGKKFDFKVIKYDEKRKNIVISRRALLENERKELKMMTLDKLEEGAILKGLVKNITYYGVFVDLGGIDGLLHITDMSWGRVNHPSELYNIGDEIEVKVLKYDDNSERVSLGVKQITPDPWEHATEKYHKDRIVTGKVVSLEDYGAFVELEKGIEGLIHISEMSWTRRIKHPNKMVAIGDEVEVKILDIDVENRRISLGMKQVEPNPWDEVKEKYPVGSIVKGNVKSITNFGIFIGVEEGIDGLVRTSDITWNRKVKHPSEYYNEGDEIEAKVLSIDTDKQRFALGIKQLSEDPWKTFTEQHKVGDIIEGKVMKTVDFGVFLQLDEGIDGLLHKSEFINPEKEFKIDDTVKVAISDISETNRKISLSEKAVEDAEELKNLKEVEARTGEIPERLGSMGDAIKNSAFYNEKTKEEEETKTEKESVAKNATPEKDVPEEEPAEEKASEEKPAEEKTSEEEPAEEKASEEEEKPSESDDDKKTE